MKKDEANRAMTRRNFLLSLFGAVGSALVGFGAFDYMKNMKKAFKSDYFINGRFRNIEPVDVMKKGTNLDTWERWIFDKKETFPKRNFHFTADKIQGKASEGLKSMWTGHSSVYLEIEDKRFFCDPVWSLNLSPVRFGGPKRFFAPPVKQN